MNQRILSLALMVVGVMAVISTSHAAQQTISQIGVPATLGAYRIAVNTEFDKVDDNFGELYTLKADKSCFATESAFNSCFDLTWATGGGIATDATITTTDVTTNNASTTKHGWMVKATAPSSGMRNIVAIDNGETAYTNKALFDATSPSTQALGDSAVIGTAMTVARRDHKHAMPSAQTATTTAFTPNGSIAATTVQAAIQEVRDESGSGVSLSTANTWTALQTFSNGISAASITSSAADGTHYLDIVNGVSITATATLGRIAYYNGRMHLADGTDWDGYFLEDTDIDDTPDNGSLTTVPSANWAYDHATATDPHSGYVLESSIISGTVELNTTTVANSGVIASGASQLLGTHATATGAATDDSCEWGFVGDPVAKTGFVPSANGMLSVWCYVDATGYVQVRTINNTASSITLNTAGNGATIKWMVRK